MQWTKPDFEEISLGMEVTAYVNTDDAVQHAGRAAAELGASRRRPHETLGAETAMQIRILGSAAGGGVPQWNCRCPNCEAARAGSPDVRPRTQSSVAVSADGRAWFLLNVSPDVRQQILAFPELGPPPGRARAARPSPAAC